MTRKDLGGPAWREGRSALWWDWYIGYMLSDEWAAFKTRLFKTRGRKCEWCGASPTLRTPISLHVHHLSYANLGNELDEDVVILCSECHEVEHRFGKPSSDLAKYTPKRKAPWRV